MDINKTAEIKKSSDNDRPLFMKNGTYGLSMNDSQEISNFRQALPQFLAVSVKNILLFVYGMTLGFPTIVIPAIQGGEGREPSDITLNKEEISWFSSINLICVPLGCLFSGLLTQPIGKRRAMQFVNLPIIMSWIFFHFATKTEHLYAALCLSGLGGGLMEAPVLTYVAEISEPKYRGILSALGSMCVITGVFIQFIMGSLMDWRTIAAVSSVFPVISIILLCFVPESPTWLIRKQRFQEAIKALQWLRGWVTEQHIEEEFNRLYDELITQPALEKERENSTQNIKGKNILTRFRMFKKRSCLVPFILVSLTFFIGHFSGRTSLQTYAVQIFHTLKAPINKYHATILLGVAELFATIICVFLIHLTGKRPLVLISTVGVTICWFVTAFYAHYLKVVPGFAINNVVLNASSILPKDNVISLDNISKIFESNKNTSLVTGPWDIEANMITLSAFGNTTISEASSNRNISKSETSNNIIEPYNISFVDLTDLDYNDNKTNYVMTTPQIYSDDSNMSYDNLTKNVMLNDLAPLQSIYRNKTIPSKKLSSLSKEILIEVPKQENNFLAWIPLIFLLGAAFSANVGIRMIPWILIGEVFPAAVRSTASGLVSGLGYIFGFLANKLFLQMISALTLPGTFWLYSAVSFVGAITLYYILPETEGRTLGEIEAHFSKKSDKNLLCKKQQNMERISKHHKGQQARSLQLNKLENSELPTSLYTEVKTIKLQQNDFLFKREGPDCKNANENRNQDGVTNIAYDGNNTTHL